MPRTYLIFGDVAGQRAGEVGKEVVAERLDSRQKGNGAVPECADINFCYPPMRWIE